MPVCWLVPLLLLMMCLPLLCYYIRDYDAAMLLINNGGINGENQSGM